MSRCGGPVSGLSLACLSSSSNFRARTSLDFLWASTDFWKASSRRAAPPACAYGALWPMRLVSSAFWDLNPPLPRFALSDRRRHQFYAQGPPLWPFHPSIFSLPGGPGSPAFPPEGRLPPGGSRERPAVPQILGRGAGLGNGCSFFPTTEPQPRGHVALKLSLLTREIYHDEAA